MTTHMWAPNKRFYGGQREAKRRRKKMQAYTHSRISRKHPTHEKKTKHTHTHSRRKRSQLWVQLCVPTCNTHRFRWEEGDDSLHTAVRHPAWRRNILETKCYYISLCFFLCLKKKVSLVKICPGFEGSRVTDNCCFSEPVVLESWRPGDWCSVLTSAWFDWDWNAASETDRCQFEGCG